VGPRAGLDAVARIKIASCCSLQFLLRTRSCGTKLQYALFLSFCKLYSSTINNCKLIAMVFGDPCPATLHGVTTQETTTWTISTTVNLPDYINISRHFHFCNCSCIKRAFHTEFIAVCMVYLLTNFHITSNGPLVSLSHVNKTKPK
jgi:hypothetical protein